MPDSEGMITLFLLVGSTSSNEDEQQLQENETTGKFHIIMSAIS